MNNLFSSWGFGWVDKAQSSDRPGAVGSEPGLSRVFHDIWLLASRHLSRNTHLPQTFQTLPNHSTLQYHNIIGSAIGPNRGSGAGWVYGSEVCAMPPRSFVTWSGLLPDFLAPLSPPPLLSLSLSLLLLLLFQYWNNVISRAWSSLSFLFPFSDPSWLALAPRQCLNA